MLDRGEPEPNKLANGELAEAGVLAVWASSSSPKILFRADIAGLRPAIASGVSKSDGINGAENSKPSESGLDSRLDRPKLEAWRSWIVGRLVKNGA